MINRCILCLIIVLFIPLLCSAVTGDVSIEGILDVAGSGSISNSLNVKGVTTLESMTLIQTNNIPAGFGALTVTNLDGTGNILSLYDNTGAGNDVFTVADGGAVTIKAQAGVITPLTIDNQTSTGSIISANDNGDADVFNVRDGGSVVIYPNSIPAGAYSGALLVSNRNSTEQILRAFDNVTEVFTIADGGTITVPTDGALVLNNGTARPYVVSENTTQQIIQTGFVAGTGAATVTVAFPVAFSSAPIVMATAYDDAGAYNNNLRFNVTNISTTGFDIKAAGVFTTPDGFDWIAIGNK